MEYGRRIAAGELLDGDTYQVRSSLYDKSHFWSSWSCIVSYLNAELYNIVFKTLMTFMEES